MQAIIANEKYRQEKVKLHNPYLYFSESKNTLKLDDELDKFVDYLQTKYRCFPKDFNIYATVTTVCSQEYKVLSSWQKRKFKTLYPITAIIKKILDDFHIYYQEFDISIRDTYSFTKFLTRHIIDNIDYYLDKGIIHAAVSQNDTDLVKKLIESGAKFQQHQISKPNYNSWANISDGLRLILETDDYKLDYIPHQIPGSYLNQVSKAYKGEALKWSLKGTYTFDKKLKKKILRQINIEGAFMDYWYARNIALPRFKHLLGKQIFIQKEIISYETVTKSHRKSSWERAFKRALENNNVSYDIDVIVKVMWKNRNKYLHIEEESICNQAPLSEKGHLKVWIKSSQNKVLQELATFGIISSSKNIESSSGYVHQYQKEKISLPSNHLIIHGMTGCNEVNSAASRLESMTKQSGILSQKQRRDRNIHIKTMSPLGDMASGLDWAVPATITTHPVYGNYIFFVLNPKLLTRKYMFFAPKDFGGGKNRLHEYNNYASKLGTRDIRTPLTSKQKREHIKNIPNLKDNEVWFDHSVDWEDITHIIVDKRIYDKSLNIINNNLKTQHIKVVKWVCPPIIQTNVTPRGSNLRTKIFEISNPDMVKTNNTVNIKPKRTLFNLKNQYLKVKDKIDNHLDKLEM